MDALAIALWVGAFGGLIAMGSGVLGFTRRRSTAFLIAAALFLPIGVFGILSIGAAFLALALTCLVLAVVSRPTSSASGTADRG